MTDDLIAWLNAQLDEDERRAEWAATLIDGKWDSWQVVAQQLFACCDTVPRIDRVGQHLMHTSDPARVLREAAAKRSIIEAAEEASGLDAQVDGEFRVGSRDPVAEPYIGDIILRALAAVYSDRPGYREEWTPATRG